MSTIIHLDDARGRDADEPLLSLPVEYQALQARILDARAALDGLAYVSSFVANGLPLNHDDADKLIDRLDLAATGIETQWARFVVARNWGTP
jgi:hypothetical protein